MKKLLLSGIAVLGVIAVLEPAFADEAPRRDRPQQVRERPQRQQQQQQRQTNWDGGQLGGSNGSSGVNNNFAEPGAYICPIDFEFGVDCFETPFSFGGTKWVYTWGVFAGYRQQFGGFVAGFEGDLHFKNGEHSATQATTTCFEGSCDSSGDVFRRDLKAGSVRQTWDASLRVRGGFLATQDTLLYGTVGVAFGQVRGTFHYHGELFEIDGSGDPVSFGDTAVANGRFSEIRTGWTAGFGAETEIWRGVKARAEYRYTDLGSFSVNLPVTSTCVEFGCDTPSNKVRIDLDHSFHTIRFGVGIDLF